ncbi:MAG: hypothetical protein U0795_16020 [Pirellulales bacterium]
MVGTLWRQRLVFYAFGGGDGNQKILAITGGVPRELIGCANLAVGIGRQEHADRGDTAVETDVHGKWGR